MKAILEFNLPEEDAEMRHAINAGKYNYVCFAFDQFLMRFDKHRDIPKEAQEILEEIRKQWNELTEDFGEEL